MRRTALAVVSAVSLSALFACARGPSGQGSGESAGGRSSSSVDDDPNACTATFIWWQKDAYFNSPGRSYPLWPPHTATELQVSCGGAIVNDVSQGNHGSTPGLTDDAGTPMLVDVLEQSVTGSMDDMNALVAAYQSCQCDSTTQFLSLDDVPDATMQQVLTTVLQYLNQNLYCPGSPSTSDVVNMIQNGDYEDAAAAMPQCAWADGSSFEDGLQQAASQVLGQLGQTLAGYHVCNNDAMLQANLFTSYVAGSGVVACDSTTSVCAGPSFFYNPSAQ
ncbi:MAG TPA: hypothetical protein VMI75_28600 [Polyangiaceae bacterium]|nr:hypothetical protein [Polyangiaceae bacterium]